MIQGTLQNKLRVNETETLRRFVRVFIQVINLFAGCHQTLLVTPGHGLEITRRCV